MFRIAQGSNRGGGCGRLEESSGTQSAAELQLRPPGLPLAAVGVLIIWFLGLLAEMRGAGPFDLAVYASPGTYNVNSLTLSGNSIHAESVFCSFGMNPFVPQNRTPQ